MTDWEKVAAALAFGCAVGVLIIALPVLVLMARRDLLRWQARRRSQR